MSTPWVVISASKWNSFFCRSFSPYCTPSQSTTAVSLPARIGPFATGEVDLRDAGLLDRADIDRLAGGAHPFERRGGLVLGAAPGPVEHGFLLLLQRPRVLEQGVQAPGLPTRDAQRLDHDLPRHTRSHGLPRSLEHLPLPGFRGS